MNRAVVVADEQAVVAVEADPPWVVLGVGANIAIEHDSPTPRRVMELVADTGQLVELAVGLPAVYQSRARPEAVGGETAGGGRR